MTGFGRGSATTENATATVEIAGVNRKQTEIVIQGLRDLAELENEVRKAVTTRISRGRLQITIDYRPLATDRSAVRIDTALATDFDAAFAALSKTLGRDLRPSVTDFLKAPGLVHFEGRDLDSKLAWEAIAPALEAALEQLLEMRANEGRDLGKDLQHRLDLLESLKSQIATLAPARPARYREQLAKRLADAGLADSDLSDERLLRELALFADRCDISEETTRLDSHFRKFREYLAGSEAAGRPLDFLCQEIHREFNTIGSKATDAAIAQHVVAAKTELERIREQVQNIE